MSLVLRIILKYVFFEHSALSTHGTNKPKVHEVERYHHYAATF